MPPGGSDVWLSAFRERGILLSAPMDTHGSPCSDGVLRSALYAYRIGDLSGALTWFLFCSDAASVFSFRRSAMVSAIEADNGISVSTATGKR